MPALTKPLPLPRTQTEVNALKLLREADTSTSAVGPAAIAPYEKWFLQQLYQRKNTQMEVICATAMAIKALPIVDPGQIYSWVATSFCFPLGLTPARITLLALYDPAPVANLYQLYITVPTLSLQNFTDFARGILATAFPRPPDPLAPTLDELHVFRAAFAGLRQRLYGG